MKQLLFTCLSCLLLISCDSKQGKAIKDYEQTVGNTKLDLSISIKSLTLIKEFTGIDSLKLFTEEIYDGTTDSLISELNKTKNYIDEFLSLRDIYKDSLDMELSKLKPRYEYVSYYQGLYDLYNNEDRISSHKKSIPIYEKAIYYSNNRDKILGNIWKCTYKIKNPILNITQEITKEYFFSPDNSTILFVIKGE